MSKETTTTLTLPVQCSLHAQHQQALAECLDEFFALHPSDACAEHLNELLNSYLSQTISQTADVEKSLSDPLSISSMGSAVFQNSQIVNFLCRLQRCWRKANQFKAAVEAPAFHLPYNAVFYKPDADTLFMVDGVRVRCLHFVNDAHGTFLDMCSATDAHQAATLKASPHRISVEAAFAHLNEIVPKMHFSDKMLLDRFVC